MTNGGESVADDELDALIDAACGEDPVAAGTARRWLGRLAAQQADGLVRQANQGSFPVPGATGVPAAGAAPGPAAGPAAGPAPDATALARMVEVGLIRRVDGGLQLATDRVRDHLAARWRRLGPIGLTLLPARTRLDFGWAVDQGPRPCQGNEVEFLVDNEAAWGRLAEEVARAEVSVRGLLFMLDVPHVRMGFSGPGAAGGFRLEDRLIGAADRGVAVHLVLNHVTPAFSPANTTWPVEAYFRRRDPRGRVRLRRLVTPQTLPIHGKVYVIDDRVAYLIGSVFAQEYFDGREHRIDDPRRGHVRWRSSVRAPVHDVSLRVEGPAVADLDATVRLHWNAARSQPGDEMPAFRSPERTEQPVTGETVQVTRSLQGGGKYADRPAGETGIFESYLRALESARRFVYLENQYLTSPDLVNALIRALDRAPELRLIALVNIKPDLPHYVAWQREALERLLTADRDRIGIFSLWTQESNRILRNHVHSKVAIVDDEWLTIGSANLDGVSLTVSDHELRRPPLVRFGRLLGGTFGGDVWQARASEVNLTCVGDAAVALRRTLWSEHLGCAHPDDPALAEPPLDGWLGLWRRRADEKLNALRNASTASPRVLPFPHREGRLPKGVHQAERHLRALGIDTSALQVLESFRSFSFTRGGWR